MVKIAKPLVVGENPVCSLDILARPSASDSDPQEYNFELNIWF